MTISTSTIVEDRAQRDGRRHVTERHVDHVGVVFLIPYMGEAGANVNTLMAARVAILEAAAIANELEQLIATLPPNPTLNYATIGQAGTLIRNRFKDARGLEAGRIAVWLLARTDAQLRNAFGMTQGQVDALKIRLQAAADKYNAAIAMTGE
jgi:hypothetical protein